MDRVRILVPTLVGAVAVLGQQGARLGPFVVPTFGWGWVLLIVALSFVSAPRRDDRNLGRRDAIIAFAIATAVGLLWLARASVMSPALSLPVELDDDRVVVVDSLQLDARNELRRLSGRRRNVRLSTEAVLEVPRDGEYRFEVDCDDRCTLSVGETRFSETTVLSLEQGQLPFALVYRQLGGPAHLRLRWDTPALVELLPLDYFLRDASAPTSRKPQRWKAHAALVLALVAWGSLSAWAARLAPYRTQIYAQRWVPATAAACIILYGCLLRFDALWVHSGHEGPVPLGGWLPAYSMFNPANAPDDPYRADVRSYLDRAETFSLGSFYAPSFREPFYIALSLPFLKLAGGEVGILIQSFMFSCATLVLFFVVAAKLYGLWWASGLLVPIALHAWLVLEAPTGYRMSAYAFFLLLTTAVMFLASTSARGAVATGVLSAGLFLIRLSALSVVVPLLALRLWRLERRERLRYGGIVLALMAVLVGPFLISNAVAHGDPFYAVSFHTEFWLRAEGLDPSDGPVSLGRYFGSGRVGRLAQGTALGLTTLPIRTFWRGLQQFLIVDAVVLALGVIGLLWSLRSNDYRFLPVAYWGHLIPFAYIQNFPSGEMPRFVMPAYFFLVLAVPVGARALTRRRTRSSPPPD